MPWKIVVIVAVTPILMGCVTHHDLTQHPAYRDFVGARYRLRQDLFVVIWDDGSGAPGTLMRPAQVGEFEGALRDAVGETRQGKTILDVVPAETLIEVVDIQLEKHVEMGETVRYFVRPAPGSTQRVWLKLQARFIQGPSHEGWQKIEPVMLDPQIATRVKEPGAADQQNVPCFDSTVQGRPRECRTTDFTNDTDEATVRLAAAGCGFM